MHRIEGACGCHTGRVRRSNEDNYCFAGAARSAGSPVFPEVQTLSVSRDRPVSFGVFDGMGGEAFGEAASSIAAEALRDALESDPLCGLERVCLTANDRICREMVRRRVKAMGSTAVILRLRGSDAELANIGDSRAFLLRADELRQISVDHTDEAFFRELGVMDRTPRLTQHLGIDPDEMIIEPYITSFETFPGDLFLLCSDGLTSMVSPGDMKSVLSTHAAPAEMVKALIDRALSNGGKDNVTVIVCKIV